MPSQGRALVVFADGSRMLAELARLPEPTDTVLILHKALGVPKAPGQAEAPASGGMFESLAAQADVLRTAGPLKEIYIAMQHVLAVKLVEEKAQFGPTTADMEEIFK